MGHGEWARKSHWTLRAVWRQLRGMNTWEKTAHVGAHRSNPAAAAATQPGILFDKEEVAHV